MKITDFDLFIFDFDGTLMNTEEYHSKAWNEAIADYKNNKSLLSYTDYQKNFHNLNKNHIKTYLKTFYDIHNFDEIYEKKQKYYKDFIINENVHFIEGADIFLKYLISLNKKIVIVSNTSYEFIQIFKNKYPILNNINKIYTKEFFKNRKPDPECYFMIENEFKEDKKIGFEDSIIGLHALYQVKSILPVLIYDHTYYYNNIINDEYPDVIKCYNYDIKLLQANMNNIISNQKKNNIDHILENNIHEFNKNYIPMKNAIYNITNIIKDNEIYNPNIYLSGMGKSGYICKKSASTWQSLSLKSFYIDLPNLPHGDFGIFRDHDILILVSNSGNTNEIIFILDYIKNNLNKKIITISIVANKNSKMEELSDYTFILENIIESDTINMTPSTSSLIFMSLLDAIAIHIRQDISIQEFKLYHPSGSLGKRL